MLWYLQQAQQVAFAFFKHELEVLWLNQLGGQQPCGYLCERQEQAHGWTGLGDPFIPKTVAFDVSIVDPNAVSHSGAGACGESFLNPNCRDH